MLILYKKFGYPCLIREDEQAAKARPGLARQLQQFKRTTRWVVRNWFAEERQKLLFRSGDAKGYALKRLGVCNHAAHINCLLSIPEKMRQAVDLEVLYLNGNKKADLGGAPREGDKVRLAKLDLRNKVTWSKKVRALPKQLLDELPQAEVLVSDAEEPKAAATRSGKRKSGDLGLELSTPPPSHDFVQPAVVCTNKKACTTKQPVLRIGMLSAKLKERFGHLCTETG